MSTDTTRFVRLFRRHTGRGIKARWDTCIGVCADDPRQDGTLNAPTTIAVFQVDGAATNESAVGVVAEWLYRGRPASMTVTEIRHRASLSETARL